MVLGNAMTLREFYDMLARVQSGQTTPADEMCRNYLIPSPGTYDNDDIDRLYSDEPPEGI